MVDIIRRRRIKDEKLEKALEDAMAADKAKNYFLASMSHEIRTPLNAVIGFSNLLKDESVKCELKSEYIDNISFAALALLDMINDVLDLSKLESGNFEIMPKWFDFKKICYDIVEMFQHKALKKNLSMQIEIGEMPIIFADDKRIRQILFNLLSNAIKFTPKGTVLLKAKYIPSANDIGKLAFSVTDSGIGINKADCQKIFNQFIQGTSLRGTFAENNGTGLGLPICKQILNLMNGSISVESEIGKGATFNVEIDNVKSKSEAIQVKLDNSNLKESNWAGKKVLLVDDVKMNLQVLNALVKKNGAVTTLKNNPKEALAVAINEDFDIVLTDIWMPDMNGAELAGHIRKAKKDILIYAITADSDAGKSFDMSAFNGIIIKPVKPNLLKDLL